MAINNHGPKRIKLNLKQRMWASEEAPFMLMEI